MTANFSRKRKTLDPCLKCFLHKSLCICAVIPILDLQTRLILVVHAKELKRTTNTGRLALHALVNSQIQVRGEGREALDLSPLLGPEYESLLLYPGEESIELSDFLQARTSNRSVQLIVPDGNWRQASKVAIRHPELKNVPRVKVTPKTPSQNWLRKEHFAEGLSTLEAIAAAFGFLEGDAVEAKLRNLYRAKLEATLKGRGQKSTP